MRIEDLSSAAQLQEVQQKICDSYFSQVAARAGVNIVARTWNLKEEDGTVSLNLNGPLVSWAVDVNQILARLASMETPRKVVMDIQSPGGFASSGFALYNRLRQYADEGVEVESRAGGIVASAAAVAFLGGDRRVASKGSTFMYHPPWSFIFAMGSREEISREFSKTSNQLGAMEQTVLGIFEERLRNKSLDKSATSEDIWLVGDEAKEKNVATEMRGVEDEEEQEDQVKQEVTTAEEAVLPASPDKDLRARAMAALAFAGFNPGGSYYERS